MSSDENETFMTGGGESLTSSMTSRHAENADPNLSLTRPHLSPTRLSTARQTIMGAVENLEQENEELRRVNNRMLAEMEQLRAENDQLKKDLDSALLDREESISQLSSLTEDNKIMEDKLKIQAQHFAEENRKYYAVETSLKQENDKYQKDFENLKMEFSKKESEVRSLAKELDVTRTKLEQASRKNFHNPDVEIYHEMEMLKGERNELIYERDEGQKLIKKYSNEIKNLETSLEQRTSELRNENRRHSLLTKEFNSLLEENNHLKQQLRRRRQGTQTAKEDIGPPLAVPEVTGKQQYTSGMTATREPSFADGHVTKSQQRSGLLSREKMRSREKSGARSDISTQSSIAQSIVRESEQEFTLDRNMDRKLISKRNPPGSRSDSDTSPSPEGLPAIPGGRTWRP